MLLRDQLRIPRIQLQKLLHILQLALRIPDLRINPFQGSLQFRGIAANLDSDPPDSVPLPYGSPPKSHNKGTKKAPAILTNAFIIIFIFFFPETWNFKYAL